MSITTEQKFHGSAFKELIDGLASLENQIYYNITPTNETRSGYVIEAIFKNQVSTQPIKLGLYIKHSSKRRSPWRYSFKAAHQMEMDLLKNDCDEMFLILVAGNDGIASINYATLKEILDENFDEDEWISLSRKSNQSYRVAGSNGRLKTTLAKNTFPNLIADFINNKF
jgi:hypothetical protein